jgi:hypothetical protein
MHGALNLILSTANKIKMKINKTFEDTKVTYNDLKEFIQLTLQYAYIKYIYSDTYTNVGGWYDTLDF